MIRESFIYFVLNFVFMLSKRGMFILLALSLLATLVSAQRFFDPGFGPGGSGPGSFGPGGFGFISSLCDNYGDWFEFFILFAIFYVIVAHWAFKDRPKSNVVGVAVGLALALAIIRWESYRGFSLVCGLGDTLGGLFGGFVGIVLLLIIIFGFFALARGGNGAKTLAGAAYILFYFWLGSEGGFYFSDLFYYLPFDPFFIDAILNILLFVAVIFVIIYGYKWFKEGGT